MIATSDAPRKIRSGIQARWAIQENGFTKGDISNELTMGTFLTSFDTTEHNENDDQPGYLLNYLSCQAQSAQQTKA